MAPPTSLAPVHSPSVPKTIFNHLADEIDVPRQFPEHILLLLLGRWVRMIKPTHGSSFKKCEYFVSECFSYYREVK